MVATSRKHAKQRAKPLHTHTEINNVDLLCACQKLNTSAILKGHVGLGSIFFLFIALWVSYWCDASRTLETCENFLALRIWGNWSNSTYPVSTSVYMMPHRVSSSCHSEVFNSWAAILYPKLAHISANNWILLLHTPVLLSKSPVCPAHTKFHSQTNQYVCSLPQTKRFPPNEFMFKSTIITKPNSAWLLDIPNVHVCFVQIQQKRWSLNTQQQNKLHIFRKSPPAPNPQLTKSDPKFLKKTLSGTKESSQHQSKPQPWHLPS